MTPLNNQQKQLLFDYCIGITSEKEAAEAQQLIFSNEEATELHSKFKAAIAPLETVEPDPCPDDLAEGTIWRLNNFARSSQLRLEQLLATEQAHRVTNKGGLWRHFFQMAGVAAVILALAGVVFPPLQYAREKSWQPACQMQLYRMGQGISSYSSDHEGRLPAVATTKDAPWWKVGYPGPENHSNTRHIFLLVKGDYVNPTDFVCPGRRQGRAIQFDASKAKNYNDFPARRYMTYSLRIMCDKSKLQSPIRRKALIADLNPLFERLPKDYSNQLKLHVNEALKTMNSTNHNGCGQNILFCDGSVEFVKTRYVGIVLDDIFTLRDTQIYQGTEVPSYESDAFLAP